MAIVCFGFATLAVFLVVVIELVVGSTGAADGGEGFEEESVGKGEVDVGTGRVYGGTVDSGGPVHVNVGVLVGGIVAVDETVN